MKKQIPCHIVEDLIPLYLEKQVSEETTAVIQDHLKTCLECKSVFELMSSNPFADSDHLIDNTISEDNSSEKTYLLRAKRLFLNLTIAGVVILIIFAGSSYFVGKSNGEYSERFKLADRYDLFYEVNLTKEYEGSGITVSKVLLDTSITTLILNSDVDIDNFDSITLRDNLNNFYKRAIIPFERQDGLKNQNLTVLDFQPAHPQASSLFLEFGRNKSNNGFTSVVFEIPINRKDYKPLTKYENLLETVLSGIELKLLSLERGISYTALEMNLDFGDTGIDGVSFGWVVKDGIKDLTTLQLKPDSELNSKEIMKVLSVADITMERLIPDQDKLTIPRQYNRTYQFITPPLPDNSESFSFTIDNLYAFQYIHQLDLPLIFADTTIDLNQTYPTPIGNVILKTAEKNKDTIRLYYEVKDKEATPLPAYLLDARIRDVSDTYGVPEQGEPGTEGNRKYLEFAAKETDQYLLDLSRIGYELDFGSQFVSLK